MRTPPGKGNGKGKKGSPIDARQRALQEQEEKLRREMEQCQRLIEEAPKLAAEEERRRREELIQRASMSARRYEMRAIIPDKRYDVSIAPAMGRKRLRKEKQEGRLQFVVLCLVLAAVLFWLYIQLA